MGGAARAAGPAAADHCCPVPALGCARGLLPTGYVTARRALLSWPRRPRGQGLCVLGERPSCAPEVPSSLSSGLCSRAQGHLGRRSRCPWLGPWARMGPRPLSEKPPTAHCPRPTAQAHARVCPAPRLGPGGLLQGIGARREARFPESPVAGRRSGCEYPAHHGHGLPRGSGCLARCDPSESRGQWAPKLPGARGLLLAMCPRQAMHHPPPGASGEGGGPGPLSGRRSGGRGPRPALQLFPESVTCITRWQWGAVAVGGGQAPAQVTSCRRRRPGCQAGRSAGLGD